MKSILFLSMAAVAAWAQTPAAADPVVLTIGSEKITKSMFDAIIEGMNDQQKAQLQLPGAKRNLAEQIADLKMMAQEGRVRRLDQSPAVQAKIVLQAETILAQAVYQEMVAAPPPAADVEAYYKEHETEWMEAKGRHILIRFEGSRVPPRDGKTELTEDQALAKTKELRAKIAAGTVKFEDAAKEESDDMGSGENGGELGSFGPGQMVDEFDAVAFTIPVGQVSEPVKSAFGYHLIRIDERGSKKLDEVREEIVQALKPQIGAKAVDALKEKAVVVYNPDYFGPEPVAAPESPAAEPAK